MKPIKIIRSQQSGTAVLTQIAINKLARTSQETVIIEEKPLEEPLRVTNRPNYEEIIKLPR